MTRMTKNNLIFYFTAIAGGCLLLSACYFPYFLATGARPASPLREFLLVYLFTMLVGAIPQALSAFLLRRICAALRWEHLWQWIIIGVAISSLLFLALAQMGEVIQHWSAGPNWLRTGLMFIFVGPVFLARNPLWLPLPAAIGTAALLFLVQRRLSAKPMTSAASNSQL